MVRKGPLPTTLPQKFRVDYTSAPRAARTAPSDSRRRLHAPRQLKKAKFPISHPQKLRGPTRLLHAITYKNDHSKRGMQRNWKFQEITQKDVVDMPRARHEAKQTFDHSFRSTSGSANYIRKICRRPPASAPREAAQRTQYPLLTELLGTPLTSR